MTIGLKSFFTHVGLAAEVEYYDVCEKEWNGHLNNLVKFINEEKELPE